MTGLPPALVPWKESLEIFPADIALAIGPWLGRLAAAIGPLIQDTFGRAYKAGVKIVFGTDSGVSAHGDNAWEFVYMVAAGMPPAEAIRSATLSPAIVLGREDQQGAIEAGLVADIIAVPGNPLEDVGLLRDVRFVMKDGVIYKSPDAS